MATLEEQKSAALNKLNYMFDFLGLNASCRAEEKNERIAIKISSDDAGRIIGRNGQTLESLQYLLNLVLFKQDKEFPRVMLDIDGYIKGERRGGERQERSEDNRREGRDNREDRPDRHQGHVRRERRGGDEEGGGMSEEMLSQQANDIAKEVKRWGDPVTLPAMNAHDRRIIHVSLQDDPEITTESLGEGSHKKVVISLKKSE